MCSAKRENSNLVFQSNCIILDIEGTTTSITFVKDVLFPYVRKHLDTFVQENWDSECFQEIVKALRIQAKEDKEKNLDGVIDIPENGEKDEMVKAVIQNVLWQMDLDSKAKSLKELQGLIMEIGYKNGEIKGHVYEDVEPNLKMWTDLGKDVYIYSSGSVYAQKLLYGHSEKGDLLPFIRGHFDTTVGKKGEVESYKKIVEQISSSPSETVFFTDVPNEAKAAKEAGLSAILLSREGNAPLTDEDTKMFQVIKSFSEIQFENNSKKRKICTKKDTENENKIVKPCGVSLKSLKEPSHSPLIKEPDVIMEVEESNIEEENLNLEKSNEKLNTEFCENGDVEMNAVIAFNEKNESTTQDDNAVSDTNKEKLQRKTPEDLKFESEEHDTKKKVSEDKPSAFIQDKQNKSEPVCDRIESENIVKESTTTNNETKEKCKSFQEVIYVDANKPRIISGKKEVTEVETVDVNPKCEVQHNGGSESNFSNEVETSKDTSLEKQNNEDSPINIRTEKSSECLNGIHNPKLVVGDKENTPSKLDLLKDSKVHTNDKSMIENQKQPESEQFSDRDNYNAEISKMPNSSENYKGMDDEPSPIVNDDVNNVTSPEDNAAVITDFAASKATVNEVENSSDVIQTESEKECPTLTFDSTSCHTTEEAEDKAKKDDATLENIQSDEIKTEEISCDSEKHTTIEGRAVTLNDVDSNLNPCVDIKAAKSVSESVSKQQIVCESDSVETKSEKIEMDEGSIQMSKEVKDSGEKEAESEKMKMDEEVVLISNMVNGSPEKAGSEKVEMAKGNVHNMGSGEEAAKTEKMELDEESVQNSQRGNSHEEAKSEKMELDEENSQTSKEVNDSHKETAKSEEMEMDDGNSVTGKEVNDSDEEKKSGNVLSVKLPEVSKLNESSDFNTNAHLDKVSFSETQNHSDTENSEQDRVEEMSNKVKLSQITNEKLTEESDFIPHANDLTAASEIKNDTTDDISKEHDTNETMKSNNEKMGDNSESIEHRHDQGVKNEIEEDAVSEVKKFEVPENTVITAVVEA